MLFVSKDNSSDFYYALNQLYVGDRHLTTEDDIREGWASYFEKLATPADDPTYDADFKQQVDLDLNLICNICSSMQDNLPEISCERRKLSDHWKQ